MTLFIFKNSCKGNDATSIPSQCCALPHIVNGELHYNCSVNPAVSNDFGCYNNNGHQWVTCHQPEGAFFLRYSFKVGYFLGDHSSLSTIFLRYFHVTHFKQVNTGNISRLKFYKLETLKGNTTGECSCCYI